MSDDLSGFSMMDLFRMEAEERLSVLSQGLVALEGAGATAEVIEPLMRTAHSLKGAARVVGLSGAVLVAHAMEDCLVAAQKGQVKLEPAHIDELLVGVDLLVQISKVSEGEQESWQLSHGSEVEKLVSNLAAIQAGQTPMTATASAPVATPESVSASAPASPSTSAPSPLPPVSPVAEKLTAPVSPKPAPPAPAPRSDDLSGFSMMDLFRMEAEERLSVLSQGLVALEGAGATAEVIEPLMRTAHSLKGAARVVGLSGAVQVAHAMEDCLVAAQKGQVKLEPATH